MKVEQTRLFQFEVDCFKSDVSVIVDSTERDAKYDALTIAMKEFGKIARIKGEAKKVRRLPKSAFAVKNATTNGKVWAWMVIA